MKAPSPQLLRLLRASAQGRRTTYRSSSSSCLSNTTATSQDVRHMKPGSQAIEKRHLSTTRSRLNPPPGARTPNLAPRSRDRGPNSKEDTQTDFGALNVLGSTPPPATAVDACLTDGFHLSNGVKVMGGSGCLLVGGEVFSWRPWEAAGTAAGDLAVMRNGMLNAKKQWEVQENAWGLLELIWPKPELLILGLGGALHPLSPQTRKHINELGIRVDILDTRNASAQFNLLATERGVGTVAAALLPIGWKP